MTLNQRSGDTWGISGPDFLAVYLGAAVVFFVLALMFRLAANRSAPRPPSSGKPSGAARSRT
jgi:hypothetical protein